MKQNMTDGFTSLTAVVGGKGSVKGANMMKGNIFKGGFKNIIKNPKSLGKIMKADFKKFIKKAAATGKNVKNFTVNTFKNIKTSIKNAIQKVKNLFKKDKNFTQTIKTADGHTLKVLKDGRVVKCSTCDFVDVPDNLKNKLKNNPGDKNALKDLKKLDETKNLDPPGTFRDKNGRLRDKKTGEYTTDPNKTGLLPERVQNLPEALHTRPSLRVEVKKDILRNAKTIEVKGKVRWVDGKTGKPIPGKTKTIHPDTGKPVYGDFDFGHKQGHSWKRYQDKKTNHKKTREQIINDQNNADIYDVEWKSSNRSDGAKGNI